MRNVPSCGGTKSVIHFSYIIEFDEKCCKLCNPGVLELIDQVRTWYVVSIAT